MVKGRRTKKKCPICNKSIYNPKDKRHIESGRHQLALKEKLNTFRTQILEFLTPYNSITFKKLADEFKLDKKTVENEIKSMIENGIITGHLSSTKITFRRSSKEEGAKKKKILYGMLKTRGKIDLNIVEKILGLSKNEIEKSIYLLVGENKISGRFEQEIFILESNIDSFIELLELEFMSWNEKEKFGEKK